MTNDKPNDLSVFCTFCGKDSAEVKKIITGPGRCCICNECVEVCNDVLRDQTLSGRMRDRMVRWRHAFSDFTLSRLEQQWILLLLIFLMQVALLIKVE